MNRWLLKHRRVLGVVLGTSLLPTRAPAAVQAAAPERPRLVLAIVVDQFRYDFLERFGEHFGPGGFSRLLDGGAVFINAKFTYMPNYTAAGHATIFTGSVPAYDAIVGNAWFDRELGRVRGAVSDSAAYLLGLGGRAAEPGAASPRTLEGVTIGDQMRLATQLASKVVALSYKDRSAVLPGGRRPNGAYWFSTRTGEFVSSDYYFAELPVWVRRFDASERPDRYFGAKWELALPADAYRRRPNLPAEQSQLGGDFPYVVNGGIEAPGPEFYSAFELTPFASDHLAVFAIAAVEGESLGADEATDLLAVSFSSPDLIGHLYGPDSREVEDSFVRLDRTLARLLDDVDRRVGLERCVVFLTGDHGVAPVPEYLVSLGIDAGRVTGNEVQAAAEGALKARFGAGERWIQAFVNDQLYLDRRRLAQKRIDPREAERVAGEAVLAIPGVAAYYTRSQILEGMLPEGPLAARVTSGFHAARSGDVWLVTRPFYMISEWEGGTTHGSSYGYDTHVPLVLFGVGIRPGRYADAASPSDIAPTLAALLGIEAPPQAVGRVLSEALAGITR